MHSHILAEYHKFEYDNKVYILNVETMQAFRVNRALSEEIDKIQNGTITCDNTTNARLLAALDQLGLLLRDQALENEQESLPCSLPVKHVSLNVAQTCNLSCIYCYGINGEYGQKGYMKAETARKAVDWLIRQGMDAKELIITFFGGEPLLNFPVVKEVVQYARERAQESQKRIHFSITTNGTLLTGAVNSFMNENRFSVVISFDGDLEMQNSNRPFKGSKRSHEITKKRVEQFLKSRGGNATGRATITAYNADLKRVRDSLVQMGFKRVETTEASLPYLTAQSGNNRFQPSFVINVNQRKAMLEDLEEQARETLRAVKERKHASTSKILGIIRLLYSKRKKRYFCGVGRGACGHLNLRRHLSLPQVCRSRRSKNGQRK